MESPERSDKHIASSGFKTRLRRKRLRLRMEFKRSLKLRKSIIPPEKSVELLGKIHKVILVSENDNANAAPTGIVRSFVWLKWGAAAIVLLIAGAVWMQPHQKPESGAYVKLQEEKQERVIVESNNDNKVRRILLSDSSIVQLFKGSSISYNTSFNQEKRDIQLSGKAIFIVAKNKLKPFVVYAGDISTRVLGTRFMINTLEQSKVHVKLFEGKILIRPISGYSSMQDVYLQPGQRFVLDKSLNRHIVLSFNNKSTGSDMEKRKKAPFSAGLEFNQEPLLKVLEKLGKHYHVTFKYQEDVFDSMLVTGRILPSDSLRVVLTMIESIHRISFKEGENNTIALTLIP